MNTTILDELYCVPFSGGREPNHRSPLISLYVAKNWTTSTVYPMVYVTGIQNTTSANLA